MKRRTFLKGSMATSAVAVAAAAGMLAPGRVLASAWPAAAFEADSEEAALKAFFGDAAVMDSGDVEIKAPLQAENGAVVPIKITTSLSDAESIAVVVAKNPSPHVTSLEIMDGAGGLYSSRIKMGATSPVSAYVKAGGKLHRATQEVKVTVGGCGG